MSGGGTVIVLGGGGMLGGVQVGMLQALGEAGVRPDIVLGTSVGALNGAVLAALPPAEVARTAAPRRRRRGGWVSGNLARVVGITATLSLLLAALIAGLLTGVRRMLAGMANGITAWAVVFILSLTTVIPGR